MQKFPELTEIEITAALQSRFERSVRLVGNLTIPTPERMRYWHRANRLGLMLRRLNARAA